MHNLNLDSSFRERGKAVFSDQGELQFREGFIADVTHRTQMELELVAHKERFRGLFDESIAAIYVFDCEKNFIDSIQAGLYLLGYSREELLGMSIPDVDAHQAGPESDYRLRFL